MMFRGVHNYISTNLSNRASRELFGTSNVQKNIWCRRSNSLINDTFQARKKQLKANNTKKIITIFGTIGCILGGAFLLSKGKGLKNSFKNLKMPNLKNIPSKILSIPKKIGAGIKNIFSKFTKKNTP